MSTRFACAGILVTLLTLACGPRVEIGHGNEGGEGGTGGSVSNGPGGTATGGRSGEGSGGEAAPEGGDTGQGAAGSAGSSGSSGTGGSSAGGPIPADTGPQAVVDKVDLLLAVDNSLAMAEKQKLFAKAVPEFVKRLINPRCVNGSGGVVEQPSTPASGCPAGSKREFKALRDLHVGVITSSLGSHGASGQQDICTGSNADDHAHLLPSVREGLTSYDGQGYLKWDPDALASPPGDDDPQAFTDALGATLAAAGEHGCGFEAQLESVYRFLVDPEPPQSIQVNQLTSQAAKVGVDRELLEQRAHFLRPDSSVVVLMLTDENDCSIVDEGYGWLLARTKSQMFASTAACAQDPNDPCCQSCAEKNRNPGCTPFNDDSNCQSTMVLAPEDDHPNLRCFHQKQRFGLDLLYPTQRYVSGFGDGTVLDRDQQPVPNPLFHRDGTDRDRSLFTLAVIAGVPWQDLATEDSLRGTTLEYMTTAQLTSAGRWPVILGAPDTSTPPTDPFMIESTDDRSGQNPITGDPIVPSTSLDPAANAINGHEQHNLFKRDLQYACTFRLPEPFLCERDAQAAGAGCDCYEDDLPLNRSVCNPLDGGAADTTQYSGRAYPALRELAVLQQLGRRSVLSSICARNTDDESRSDYGYRPAFSAIESRVAATLVKP